MKEKTKKLITWLCLGIAILGSVFAVIFAMDVQKFNGLFAIPYTILLAFIALALIAMLGYRIVDLFKGGSHGLVIGLGALIVVCVVAFLLSSGSDISEVVLEKNNVSATGSRLVGMGCYTVYILLAVTIIAMIYVECARIFKKK